MIVHLERYILAAPRDHYSMRHEAPVISVEREIIQLDLQIGSIIGNRPGQPD